MWEGVEKVAGESPGAGVVDGLVGDESGGLLVKWRKEKGTG